MKNNSIVPYTNNSLSNTMPTQVVLERLRQLFAKHIGKSNAVDMPTIHKYIYQNNNCSQLQYLFRCQGIYQVMNYMKRKTYFFIIGQSINNKYKWYVVQTKEEAELYKKQIDSRVKSMNQMKQRCDLAVKQKFYLKIKPSLYYNIGGNK